MGFFDAIILGIVEGLSEFLPISSTGHLILSSKLLGIEASSFLSSFEISIQLGAILAVLVLYGRTLLFNRAVLGRVLLGVLPAALIGFLLYDLIKEVFFNSVTIVLWALLLGGIALIIFERLHRESESALERIEDLSFKKVLTIGLFQSLAVIPGLSRAAATIVGGLILGMRRKTIVEFSFLLAVPTMIGATGLDLLQSAPRFSSHEVFLLMTGFTVSFAVALLAIRWLLEFISHHDFRPFGYYRIALALLFFFIIL